MVPITCSLSSTKISLPRPRTRSSKHSQGTTDPRTAKVKLVQGQQYASIARYKSPDQEVWQFGPDHSSSLAQIQFDLRSSVRGTPLALRANRERRIRDEHLCSFSFARHLCT